MQKTECLVVGDKVEKEEDRGAPGEKMVKK